MRPSKRRGRRKGPEISDSFPARGERYEGGFWTFNGLCNGGFYMAPSEPKEFRVECANGFEGVLSADAFGITCCLYAYSLLSFSPDEAFAASCAEHFHKLREFALQHAESAAIFQATD